MKAKIIDSAALSAISPLSLRSYATFEGWKRVRPYGEYGEVYALGDYPELVLPVSDTVIDYSYSVSKAIEAFSIQKDRDELSIYKDLVHADSDVVRIRASDAEDDGSVPIESGVDIVSSARDVIASAACAAREPRRSYHLRKNQQTKEYMDKVRLGQTETGSFVVTLVAPVPPSLDPSQATLWPDMMTEPFERQVTRVLSNSLVATAGALESVNRGGGFEVFEEAVKAGTSANLCEALATIARLGDGVAVSVTWSRARPTPLSSSRTSFSRNSAEVLTEAARKFRLREPRLQETLLGYIPQLRRGKKQTHGTVKLVTIVDNQTHSVSIELLTDDYERAIEAHQRKLGVIVSGDLVREGQRWRLIRAHDLRLVNDTSD